MKLGMVVTGVVFGLASGGVAHAETASGHVRIFGDSSETATAAVARREVALVEQHCEFEVMSRRGPDPADVARCDAAVALLKAKGVAAAPAIFEALDEEETSYFAKHRLYDVLALTRDTRMVEPLVRAMAIIAAGDVEERSWEVGMLQDVLERLTHTPVGQPVPWHDQPIESERIETTRKVVAWRAWQKENEGRPHAELAAERLALARREASDADPEKAQRAVIYLLSHAPAEGLVAAAKHEKRADIPDEGVDEVRYRAEDLRFEIEQRQAIRSRVPTERLLPPKPPALDIKKVEPPIPGLPNI